jgi:eukaryotic-like serine/threonine-protein kinase
VGELMSDTVTRVMLATRLDTGTQLNDTYEIDERIASGGMGEIYRGHNIQTGEPVAIKTILPELAEQETIFALFKREATILGRLNHDTIVRYYTFSRDPRLGRPYLAMEFVDGVSLADRMKAAPLTANEVRKVFAGVADGLALAHQAGVVHRDLSPDNIILRGGDVSRPKLIDFGIAKAANIGDGTVIGGGFAGKYNFVSPEQLGIHNREVDARSDIYSLGLVMAASLRGRPLDMGGSHVDLIEKRSRVPDLSDIDETIRPLVEAMLQPDPDGRPPSMTAVAEWLRSNRLAEPTMAPAIGGFAAPVNGATAGAAAVSPTSTPWVKTKFQAGTPFAGDPTQPPAAPTQVVARPTARTEPPFGSESPFGPGPGGAQPGAASPTTPASPAAEAKPRGSGAGRLAIVGGLLLVLLGGGATAAYVTGMFDRTPVVPTPSGGQATEPPTTPKQTADTPPATPTPTAKSPEHQAIGDALEEAAKAEDAKEAQKTAQTEQPGSGPTPAPAPATPSTPTGGTIQPATTDTQPGDAGPGVSGTSADQPGVTATEPEKQMKEAAAGLTKMMDVGVAWLHQYDGGKCFFVAVTGVTDKTINVKGFGTNASSFKSLYDSFMQANNIDPELNGQLINDAQCAAVDFLKAVQPRAKDNPQLTLAADRIQVGEPLSVTVENADGKVLDLLFIDDAGLVFNVKGLASQTVSGGKMTFQIPTDGFRLDREAPEMMIALTSQSGLAVPQGKDHARAAALFLKLAHDIEEKGLDVGVDFAYFRARP